MRNSMTLAAIAAMGFLGACVGGIDQPTGDDDGTTDGTTDGTSGKTARQIFDSDVKPLLGSCAGSTCHTGPETSTVNKFLGDRGDAGYYDALVNDRAIVGGFVPASAQLLTKGAHQGPAWQPAEVTKITAWLNKEAAERGTDTTPPPPPDQVSNRSARGAEMIFAGCMVTLEAAFTTTQAYQIANLNTQNNGRCNSCHSPGGAGGLWLGPTNNATQISTMFNKWQEELFFTGVFQPQIQAGSPPIYKIAAAENKLCLKGTEKQNNLGTHPAFDCRQNNSTALNNLKNFITQVQTKVDAGPCGTPAFKPSSL